MTYDINMNEEMNEYTDGMCYVPHYEVEHARLVLAEHLGEPEPVLYDDPTIPLTQRQDDEVRLNRIIDLQEEMAPLFNRIEGLTHERDTALYVYRHWLARYRNGITHLNAYKYTNNGSIRGYAHWDLYYMVKGKWAEAKAYYMGIKERNNKRLSDLWDTVKDMPQFLECKDLVGTDKYLWIRYFNLKDGVEEQYDPRSHKKDAPEVDNRMLTSDEAYFLSHMEEQEEEYLYNTI
jgi:hypothetical protein